MADDAQIEIRQGRTETITFTYTGLDLTGFSARMKGKAAHNSASNVFSLTTGGGGLVLSPGTTSVLTATIPATTTAAMDAPLCGVFDVECFNTTTGVVYNDVQGLFRVPMEVTV